MRRQTCLTAARKYDHGVRRCHIVQRIKRYFELARSHLRIQNPQWQSDTDQRMANGCDDRLQFVQDVLRHVLVAVAQSLDARRRPGLCAILKTVPRISDLQDVTFKFHPADIAQSLPRQLAASGLHDETGIKGAAFSGREPEVTHDPAAFVRPRQDSESGEVRHGQHVPGATHGIAAKATVLRKDVLENDIGGIHGEERGRKRHSIPRRLRKQPRLDRSRPDNAVCINERDPDNFELFFVDRRENARQNVLALRQVLPDKGGEIRTAKRVLSRASCARAATVRWQFRHLRQCPPVKLAKHI